MKTCTKCGETKPADQEHFYKNKSTKDGLTSQCKECNKAQARAYKATHKEQYHELYKKYYSKDRDRYINNAKRWQTENEERTKEIARNFRRKNPEICKGYIQARQDRIPQVTKDEWFVAMVYFDYSCAYCGMSEKEAREVYGDTLHKEHVIRNGRNDLKNLVPACKSCNCEKHKKTFNEWYNPSNPKYDHDRYVKIYLWLRYVAKAV